jgi:hypothetical protein
MLISNLEKVVELKFTDSDQGIKIIKWVSRFSSEKQFKEFSVY